MFYRLLAIATFCWSQGLWAANPSLNAEEQALYEQLNAYRQQNGLTAIPISPALTQVARAHVSDLNQNPPTGSCNLHSWSAQGSWNSCCYTGNDTAQCMWDKPREISGYQGNGFETAYMNSGVVNADNALSAWKSSTAHNDVLLNVGIWQYMAWNAVGIGLAQHYAVLWFGTQTDNSQFDSNSTQCPVTTVNAQFSAHLPAVTWSGAVYHADLEYIGGAAFQLNPATLGANAQSPSACDAQLSNTGRLSIPQLLLSTGEQLNNIILQWQPNFPNHVNDTVFILQ